MKTLQEIKDEVSKENGFSCWDGASYEEESFMNNTVAKKYAEEALKEAAGKVDIRDKDSILNIIKELK